MEVSKKPRQPHQGNPGEAWQGRWAGVYPFVVTPSLLSFMSLTQTPWDLPWEGAEDAG